MTARAKLRLALAGVVVATLVLASLAWAGINAELYSASGFVKQYLSALSRQDAASALAMPGVTDGLPPDAPTALLRSSALGELREATVTGTRSAGENTIVSASFVAGGKPATADFVLKSHGRNFGIFESWAFAERPLSTVAVTVAHGVQFQVGSSGVIDLRTTGAQGVTDWGGTQSFLVLAPMAYVFSLDSTKLAAAPTQVVTTAPGQNGSVTVNVQATPAFSEQVQKELNTYLDECVTQHVLQPTGCPFGYQTGNRIVGEPTWTMVDYPIVAVTAGTSSWVVRKAVGRARITGEIQSLYDGSVSKLDKVVAFTTNLDITVRPDGSLAMTIVN